MIIKKYFRTKIGRTIIVIFLLLLLPLAGINMTISMQSARSIQNGLIRNHENSLKIYADQMSDRLQDLNQLAISLSLDDDLNALCIAKQSREDLLKYVWFREKLCSYTAQRLFSGNISVYLPKQDWVISTGDYIYSLKDAPHVKQSLENLPESMFWGIRPQRMNPDELCVSIAVGYIAPTQTNAVFLIEVNQSEILEAMEPVSQSDDILTVFLMDRGGSVFLNSEDCIDHDELIAQTEEYRSTGFAYGKTDSFRYRKDGKENTVIVYPVSHTNCVMGIVIDGGRLAWPRYVTDMWTMVSIGTLIVIAVIFTVVTHRNIVEPINRIHETMEQIGRGNFGATVCGKTSNEIGDIASSLNQMSKHLRELIDERYVYEIQLAQTQLRILRAQINPHFLYNSLFTLYTFIKNEDLDSAADLAIYLGQYYQVNTHLDDGDIPLYKELEHVRLLVQIQNMRFSGRLHYMEQVDPSLKLLYVPNLTLLTITENFLTHGMKNVRGEMSLMIEAKREGGEIVLTVADTGSGVSEEKLEEMRRRLAQIEFSRNNLHGLQNVLARFRMAYGEKTYIEVLPNEPQGLINRIHIPDEGGSENV